MTKMCLEYPFQKRPWYLCLNWKGSAFQVDGPYLSKWALTVGLLLCFHIVENASHHGRKLLAWEEIINRLLILGWLMRGCAASDKGKLCFQRQWYTEIRWHIWQLIFFHFVLTALKDHKFLRNSNCRSMSLLFRICLYGQSRPWLIIIKDIYFFKWERNDLLLSCFRDKRATIMQS